MLGITPAERGGGPLLRVCIVDEHLTVSQWLTSKFEALGIDVCAVARDVATGVPAIARHRPDVVVVDSRLPDGRGIDLCRAVSVEHPRVTLVLHAGMMSPGERSEALEAGVSRIALKSIQGDDLLTVMADLADRHRNPGR